jgi:hypothetical protein
VARASAIGLKSSGFKNTIQGALKTGLKSGVSAFTSTDGSFKDKLKSALISGAKSAVQKGSSDLLQKGATTVTHATAVPTVMETVAPQLPQTTSTANAVSRIMASLA